MSALQINITGFFCVCAAEVFVHIPESLGFSLGCMCFGFVAESNLSIYSNYGYHPL